MTDEDANAGAASQQPIPNEVGGPRDITVTRDYAVALPRRERAYLIPASEWNRVKRMVSRIVPPKNWFQVGWSLCAGNCASAVFWLLGLPNDVSFRLRVVGWSSAICSLVLGIALFYLDGQQRQDITRSSSEVTNEMTELEKLYAAGDGANPVNPNDVGS